GGQSRFEAVDSVSGKIHHLSFKDAAHASKTSVAHSISNNGNIFCFLLQSSYDIFVWHKDTNSSLTVPNCFTATKNAKPIQTNRFQLFVSNSGEQIVLIIYPLRIYCWLKNQDATLIHQRRKFCAASTLSSNEGLWTELMLPEHLKSVDEVMHSDVYFASSRCLLICAITFVNKNGLPQISRFDFDWKSTVNSERKLSWKVEDFVISIPHCTSGIVRFSHTSPILAMSIHQKASEPLIVFASLTAIAFARYIHCKCSTLSRQSSSSSLATIPTVQQDRSIMISDLVWSYDDQFVVGLTNRGTIFVVNRFGDQLILSTAGKCVQQGPLPYIIIHPLIGPESEGTTHLGVDMFMRSVNLSSADKHGEQIFSLANNPDSPTFYCSDGYRLATLTYSDRIRDKKLYDPLLYFYLLGSLRSENIDPLSLHDELRQNFEYSNPIISGDDLVHQSFDSNNRADSFVSLKSLNDLSPTSPVTIEDILSAHGLLHTRLVSRHKICKRVNRMTYIGLSSYFRSFVEQQQSPSLTTNTVHKSIILFTRFLTNIISSASFGRVTFTHISCVASLLPSIFTSFQHANSLHYSETVHFCILLIIENWLQSILYISTSNEFQLERISNNQREYIKILGTKQLQSLQGLNVDLTTFILPENFEQDKTIQHPYTRMTLLEAWYRLWLIIEKRINESRKANKLYPKYLCTIRLFIQSLLRNYPSLNAIRFLSKGSQVDLNDIFPRSHKQYQHNQIVDTKSYTALTERRKSRRLRAREMNSTSNDDENQDLIINKTPRRKPQRTKYSEARKALCLHRLLYGLIEQYNLYTAICVLNVALKRDTLSSVIPIDLFTNVFQFIDTRTHFGIPNHAIRSVLRTLARFMARAMLNDSTSLYVYSIDSARPLPNLFKVNQQQQQQQQQSQHQSTTATRYIHIDRLRLKNCIDKQNLSNFWQPLKVLELFILGQSPLEAILFSKMIGDWRTALCLAAVLPSQQLEKKSYYTSFKSSLYSPINSLTVDSILYIKLCEYLEIDNLKLLIKRQYKQEQIYKFLQQIKSPLEQFLLCSTILQAPLAEALFRRLNAIMIYLFTLLSVIITPNYYLPCPPVYSAMLNTYDEYDTDINARWEYHLRLLFYRTIQIFITLLSTTKIQLSCLKWYLDYLNTNDTEKQSQNTSVFATMKSLIKSLRFHKLPNIPDRILIYFRDFCSILFLLDIRDRLSLALRKYIQQKTDFRQSQQNEKLSWQIIHYGTILISFRFLLQDETLLLRSILNIVYDLEPTPVLIKDVANLINLTSAYDDTIEIKYLIDRLKAKWYLINPTYIEMYDSYLQTQLNTDAQSEMIKHYMTKSDLHNEPLFNFHPKWFESSTEYGEFMNVLIPLLLDTSSLSDKKNVSDNVVPLLHTMSDRLRGIELPPSLEKRYLLKQSYESLISSKPHEYVVFPVRTLRLDAQPSLFQNNRDQLIGTYNIETHGQQPNVITLNRNNQHHNRNGSNQNSSTQYGEQWDGRSDEPSRSYVRQFDEPYTNSARLSIWMTNFANRDFSTLNEAQHSESTVKSTTGLRIPVSAQFLSATSLISDQQQYESTMKRRLEASAYNFDSGRKFNPQQQDKGSNGNDTSLTNVTKDSDVPSPEDFSEAISSPRRIKKDTIRPNATDGVHDLSYTLDESITLPISVVGGDEDIKNETDRFRASSREAYSMATDIGSEGTYDLREFPTEYYKARQMSPRHHSTARKSPTKVSIKSPDNSTARQSMNSRRFFDDSDPYAETRIEQEETEKYSIPGTDRSRSRRSHRRPRTERRSGRHEQQTKVLPQISQPFGLSAKRDHVQYVPMTPNIIQNFPLLRLPSSLTTLQTSYRVVQPSNVYINHPVIPQQQQQQQYFPLSVPLMRPFASTPMLRLETAPAVSGFPPPIEQQKHSFVHNIMQRYAELNRPQLQLLRMRPPQTHSDTIEPLPLPTTNIVSSSADAQKEKVHIAVQAEVPRQDGYMLEPGLFQALLRETGINFTSAEAHFSAARQLQQQMLDNRRRERSTMTEGAPIFYDLQFSKGGQGDERKFMNVTDITGSNADALLNQIEKDQYEREQLRIRQQQQQQQRQQQQQAVHQPQQIPASDQFHQIPIQDRHRSTVNQPRTKTVTIDNRYEDDITQHKIDLDIQQRREKDEEMKRAELLTFGKLDETDEQLISHFSPDDKDVPLEYLLRPRTTEPNYSSRTTEPHYSSRTTSSHTARDINSARSTTSPRKQKSSERVVIKTTTPREPFSARKKTSPRKTMSPTISDQHAEERRKQQMELSRAREQEVLQFVDKVLYDEHVPVSKALREFELQPLETSFTSTVRDELGQELWTTHQHEQAINRTYDLDFDDDLNYDRIPTRDSLRPASARQARTNINQNAAPYSTPSSPLLPTSSRPGSAASMSRRPSSAGNKQLTPFGRALLQVKSKNTIRTGPPPASSSRSNSNLRRPLSSPAKLQQSRSSITNAPQNVTDIQNYVRRLTTQLRSKSKSPPRTIPSHKATTYNQRVRALKKSPSDTQQQQTSDLKALMRLYGTRRAPGLYKPYEKTGERLTKTYSERMRELQPPSRSQPSQHRMPLTERVMPSGILTNNNNNRPMSAKTEDDISLSLSEWSVDERVKELLADENELSRDHQRKNINRTVNIARLDEQDDDESTYSLTRVTEKNENTYADDLLQLDQTRIWQNNTQNNSARQLSDRNQTARDESEMSVRDSSVVSVIDWDAIDRFVTDQ
ncbi:unnamed protein product, partial [Didymodactylos carnosus]